MEDPHRGHRGIDPCCLSAWNGAAPQLGLENAVLTIPEWANAIVLALLGVGAANQPANLPKPNA